jgi:hypothetical protein
LQNKKNKKKRMRIKLDKKKLKDDEIRKKIYILKMIPNKINSNYKNDD